METVCVCGIGVCARVHRWCAHGCGQRLRLCVFLACSLPYFFETGSLELELINLAGLAGQWASGILLTLPPQHWNSGITGMCHQPGFSGGLGHLKSGGHAYVTSSLWTEASPHPTREFNCDGVSLFFRFFFFFQVNADVIDILLSHLIGHLSQVPRTIDYCLIYIRQ